MVQKSSFRMRRTVSLCHNRSEIVNMIALKKRYHSA